MIKKPTFDGVDKVVDNDDAIILLEEFHTAVGPDISGATRHQNRLPRTSHLSRHLGYLHIQLEKNRANKTLTRFTQK